MLTAEKLLSIEIAVWSASYKLQLEYVTGEWKSTGAWILHVIWTSPLNKPSVTEDGDQYFSAFIRLLPMRTLKKVLKTHHIALLQVYLRT